MADKLTFVETRDGVEGFENLKDAYAYAAQSGGKILTGQAAEYHQMRAEADSVTGMATAAAANSFFGLPKLAAGILGSQGLKDRIALAEEANPWSAFGGAFLAPWGAAGKFAGGAARGLFGLGEAAEAGSVLGRGASIFGEGSVLGEQTLARGAGELAAGEASARGIAPIAQELGAVAKPGFSQEAAALAGRPLTAEGAAILEAHPRSFLEAAAREGSLNAGVGAINSAGDYLLNERYMDGDPREDAGSLTSAILHGALTGGLLGSAAGVATHGAGKAVDRLMNPANAPKMRVPAALRGELEESLRRGGMSAADAAALAKNAVEHGIAGTMSDAATYNAASAFLENARIKRGLERGEFKLPLSMAGEGDLQRFVGEVTERAHAVRKGVELPSTEAAVRAVEEDFAKAASERQADLFKEARRAPSGEAAKVWAMNGYKGELGGLAKELEAVPGGERAARLIERADAALSQAPTGRLTRVQALRMLDEAAELAPAGFDFAAERAALAFPLEHASNGQKFLSVLGEHQLAEKARREIGQLASEAAAGGALTQETVMSLEKAAKQLGLEGGRLDAALREHYTNEAAKAVGAESKKLDPMLRMLGGLMAGGLASKVLGGFGGGYVGLKAARALGEAAADPIAASASIRKATAMLRYGAADIERLSQGIAPSSAPKASVMNVVENFTPWGKALWDTAPGKTARVIGQTLEEGFKALAPSMPQRAAAGLQAAQSIEAHLQEHEPQPVVPKGMNPAAMANLPPRYNDREVAAYQTRLQATVDPKGVIQKFLATGELTKEAADTLRTVHPFMVQALLAKGAAAMAKAPESERYAMARKLEVLAGPGGGYFSASSTPAFTAAVQKNYAQFQPQGPGPGGPSGNASPQKNPGPGGAQYAPVTVTSKMNGSFLQQTHASPSGALSTSLGRK